MNTRHLDTIERAEQFVWRAARLLERQRFDHLFRDGDADRVVVALEAYRCRDGGFGQALEPDFRGPISQPVTVLFALQVLDEIERFDAERVRPAVAYLERVAAADGGLPFVLENVRPYPRAPWWEPQQGQPGCLLPTAAIAGLLHRHGMDSDFRARASAFCWSAIEALPARMSRRNTRIEALQIAYESRAALSFLEHAPERARAERAAQQLGDALRGAQLIGLDASGELMQPLEYAPHPSAPARAWFDDALIARQLDALVAEQREDGGYTFAWAVWTPATEHAWRGIRTVEALKILRAYGRI